MSLVTTMAAQGNPLLAVRDLSVVFDGIVALNGVSFDMRRGQILGLIGPNGAGKTTFFNCLSRLYQPSKGDILMEGESILGRPAHRISEVGIGRTFQNVALFPNLSVFDNVRVGAHARTRSDVVSDALRLPWTRKQDGKLNERIETFALAVAMPQLLKLGTFEQWTGGVQGLPVTKPDAPFGIKVSQDRWLYYLVLGIAVLIYMLSVNLLNSRTGRAMMAIRDNEIAASSMGVNLALYKTLAFGISAGFTGVSGALGAIVVAFVAPDGYTFNFAIALFLGMVIGGVGWLPGSLAGAAFIVLVPNIAESVSKGLSGAVFGVCIIAVIFLAPNGARQLIDANPIKKLIKG